jgi:hypothetical protein
VDHEAIPRPTGKSMLFPDPDEALALGTASETEGDAVTDGAAEAEAEAVAVAETPRVVGEGPAQSVGKPASEYRDEMEATALS